VGFGVGFGVGIGVEVGVEVGVGVAVGDRVGVAVEVRVAVAVEVDAMKPERETQLAPAELRDARAALARARGKRRLDLLLESRNPQALIRALPADELYFTIREVGLADAVPLVQLASASQFRTFVDLDAWGRDGLDTRKVMPWLRAARAGSHLEPRAAARWARKLAALDRELLHLVLRTSLRVHDLEADPDPEIASDRFLRTPEGKFVVEFLVDGTEYLAVRGVLDDLYADDPFLATRLLSAIRWDLPSELEETALRWRTGRLADLGFPSLEEALSWFARPPRTPAAAPGAPARPPGFFLATLARGTLLDRAVAALAPDDREAVESQLVAAANAALVADAVDPGDLDAVREAFEGARALVELGLERLSGGDEARAAEVVRETPVKRIFQEGFLRTLELRWRAEKLLAAAGEKGAPALPSPLGEALTALVSKRPRYFPGLEAPRDEWGTPVAAAHLARPFRSPEDLSRTSSALDEAERHLARP
jgi:hypothetical protein